MRIKKCISQIRKKDFRKISLFLFLGLFSFESGNADLKVKRLRTEGLSNPIGMDVTAPKFSWQSGSDQRGVLQEAYEVNVYSDKNKETVIWSSGRIDTAKCIDIVYEGLNLQPSSRYFWDVTVWDNKGNSSQSDETAYFETGLMGTGWNDAKWIKSTTTKEAKEADAINAYSVSTDFEIKSLSAGICFAQKDANNYCMWQVNLEDSYPRLRPHIWSNGNVVCYDNIDLRDFLDVKLNTVYNIRIEIDGDIAKTFINDILIDSRKNPLGGNYGYGNAGIRQDRAWANYNILEEAYFDNFIIKDLTGDSETILFSEDFSNTDTPSFSTGTIIDGRLLVQAQYSWIKTSSSDKYDLEFDMILENDVAGIIFSATDTRNMFLWGINVKATGQPILRRHLFENGNITFTDISISQFISRDELMNKKHGVKIAVDGDTVKTYIDNILVDTYLDNSGRLFNGAVGFRAYKDGSQDEIAYYDNIKITTFRVNSVL